jgi:o-succinylbenzoate synthase
MFRFEAKPYTLIFRFEAGTSRGILTEKHGWLIKISDPLKPERTGIGEISLIPGLSPDHPEKLQLLINDLSFKGLNEDQHKGGSFASFPALSFAIETAIGQVNQNGDMRLFLSPFTEGKAGIPINGLIWMGTIGLMKARIKEKLAEGFTTIKLKVGALNFSDELALIQEIRSHYKPEELSIRLDANGAFRPDEALEKLKRLSDFNIHSIEQPIKPGQTEAMTMLCASSPIPIALDEELIGCPEESMLSMLQSIQPQYIVLKPSLLGGLKQSEQWIAAANTLSIGWWVTSALESNVGLSAIAQWTATLNTTLPQGLGTGQLYTNNFDSPLQIHRAQLWYRPELPWTIPF